METKAIVRHYPKRGESREEFFWRHVSKEHPLDCWIWLGNLACGNTGCRRPSFINPGDGKRMVSAARYAWELINGRLDPSIMVINICQEARCINPAHHDLSTRAGYRKERFIEWVDVDDALYLTEKYGVSGRSIARCFGYSKSGLNTKMGIWRKSRKQSLDSGNGIC